MFPFLYYILVVSISSMIVPELSPHGHIMFRLFVLQFGCSQPKLLLCLKQLFSFSPKRTAKVMLFFNSANFFKKNLILFCLETRLSTGLVLGTFCIAILSRKRVQKY